MAFVAYRDDASSGGASKLLVYEINGSLVALSDMHESPIGGYDISNVALSPFGQK